MKNYEEYYSRLKKKKIRIKFKFNTSIIVISLDKSTQNLLL